MKKRILCFLCMISVLVLTASPLTAAASYSLPDSVKLTAKAAVVVFLSAEMEQDECIYELNADERYAPAGLVRIMMGLYALKVLEEQNMDPAIATGTYTDREKALIEGTGLATIGMQVGDVWHVEDLLSMSMIQTAADALATLTTALAGTQQNYVDGMNAMLTEIGCTNTHFANVFGLDDPEQYTTARDVYRILRYAVLNYPGMDTMLARSEYTVHPVKGTVDSWPSTNEMLRESSAFYYRPLVYGRSGYTESLGQSCASVARDAGYEFLTVVLGCEQASTPAAAGAEGEEQEDDGAEGPAFTDTMALFRWAYNYFSYTTIVSKSQPVSRAPVALAWNTDSVALVAGRDLACMLQNDTDIKTLRYEIALLSEELTAPVEKGQVCGTATVYDGDQRVGQFELVAAESLGRSQLLAVLDGVWRVISSPLVLAVLGLLLVLLAVFAVISVSHTRRRRRKKQKRVKRYR